MAAFTTMRQALIIQLSCVTDGASGKVAAPRVLLVADGHDFTAALAFDTVSQLVADEIAATNYARQNLTFSGAVTIDTDGRAALDFDDTDFGAVGGGLDADVSGAYVFDDTGNDATSRLLYSVPFDESKTTDGGALIVRWSSPAARVSA